jgi:uncharacterized protein (TIRG00374 family)
MLRRLLGPLLGLALLTWALSHMEFDHLVRALGELDYTLVLLGVLLIQANMLLRAVRWRVLLSAAGPPRIRVVYSALIVGYGANWLLPFRVGELVRALCLRRLVARASLGLSLATIVIERALDLLWLCGAVIITLSLLPSGRVVLSEELFGVELTASRNQLAQGATVFGLLLGLAAVVLLLIRHSEGRAIGLISKIVRPLSVNLATRLIRLTTAFNRGLSVLGSARAFGTSVVHTLLIWGLSQLSLLILMMSFPFGVPVTAGQALVVLVFLAFGLGAPNAPGFVGTFHAAVVLGLLLANPAIDIAAAVSFAFLYHLVSLVPIVVVAGVFAWVDDLALLPSRLGTSDSSDSSETVSRGSDAAAESAGSV